MSALRRNRRGRRTQRRVARWLGPVLARIDGRRARNAAQRARKHLRGSVDRWAVQASARASRPSAGLVGLDVSLAPSRLRGTSWLPVVAAAVVGALFLAVLRMDVIKLRLALAESFEAELRLAEEQRELTVEMRRLRDPAELTRRAEELGFDRAERLIDLNPDEPTASDVTALELASAERRGARP